MLSSKDHKIDAVLGTLRREFPDAQVRYEHDIDTGDHKFRLDGLSYPCWLHLTDECVEDGDVPLTVDPWRFLGRGFRRLASSVPLLSWC